MGDGHRRDRHQVEGAHSEISGITKSSWKMEEMYTSLFLTRRP